MNLKDLENEIRGKHLPSIDAHFRNSIYSQIEALEQLLSKFAALSEDSSSDKIIEKVANTYEELDALKNLSDVSSIEALIEQLPGNIVIPISEGHRRWKAGDSFIVKIAKSTRQIRFFLGNKNQERTFEYRYLVGRAYSEVFFINLKWQKTLFSIVSNFLIQLKEFALNLYSNNLEESSISSLISEHQTVVGEFKIKIEQQLEEELQKVNARILKEIQIAGTIELARSSYIKDLYGRNVSAFSIEAKENARIWNNLLAVNIDQLNAASTLIKINHSLNGYEENLKSKFSNTLSKQIQPSFENLKVHLQANLEILEGDTSISKTKLEALCKEVDHITNKLVNEEIVEPLVIVCDRKLLSKYLDAFAADVARLAYRVEDKITLIEELLYKEQLPEYLLKPIQWQSLFRRILGDEYLSELLAEDIQPEKLVLDILEDFSEVEKIISTNLSIAQDVEKTEEEAPYEIAKKGIELALIKLEEIGEEYPKIEKHLDDELEKHQQELSERISRLLINQDSDEIKLEDARIKVRQSATDFKNKLRIYWAKFVDQLELGRRFIVMKIQSANKAVRSFLGLIESEHINVQKTNIAAHLHEIDLKYRKLPYIYRRLFDFKRPADASFFVKHQPHFETVSRAYELWQSDFPSSIAILGEKGSGRTTELNYLKDEIFSNDRVEEINFEKTIFTEAQILEEISNQLKISNKKSIEEVVKLLMRRRKKTVIVVENLQNCFLRTVNGYQAINALLYLISETKDNVLWVCSCSKYAWNFLNVAIKISDYFSHSLLVDNQSASNITEIIMRRQIASGYQLEIIPDAVTKNSRSFKKLLDNPEKQEEFLLEVLFERLNRIAEGNTTVAMIYWIRCISKIESADIFIELSESTGIEYLSELDSETLFILAAFVLHDVLDAKQLANCLNYSIIDAETSISRLVSRGLLVELEFGFGLNDLIYRQVVRLLNSRNFINA